MENHKMKTEILTIKMELIKNRRNDKFIKKRSKKRIVDRRLCGLIFP